MIENDKADIRYWYIENIQKYNFRKCLLFGVKNVVFNEKSRKTGNFKNRAFFGIYYIKYHFCSNERYHIRYLIMVLLIDASFLGKNWGFPSM